MIPPYTIRRRIYPTNNPLDSQWEYLKSEKYSPYGYKFRAKTRKQAETRLSQLPENEKWEISCCGA